MAVIKCKLCGGDIEFSAKMTSGICVCCGNSVTFPKVKDEQQAALFNQGNHLRCNGEFDKALVIYERIVAENDDDAEAHWCCALCRFGIVYLEDPNTYEYLPTCHRASLHSIFEDADYLAALEHSDGSARQLYQKEATKIADAQKVVFVSGWDEEPFNVSSSNKKTNDLEWDHADAVNTTVQRRAKPRDSNSSQTSIRFDSSGASLEGIYNDAVKEMGIAKTEKAYSSVARKFKTISDFKDADLLAKKCLEKAEICRKESIYHSAQEMMTDANEAAFRKAATLFEQISNWRDANTQMKMCLEKAEICRKDTTYLYAQAKMVSESISDYKEAIRLLETIPDWKDANRLLASCRNILAERMARAKAEELEEKRRAEEAQVAYKKAEKKRRKSIITGISVAFACVVLVITLTIITMEVIIPSRKYKNATKLMNEGYYVQAIAAFKMTDGYKDSNELILECQNVMKYNGAIDMVSRFKYAEAIWAFRDLGDYKDSREQLVSLEETAYYAAVDYVNKGDYLEAEKLFIASNGYKDAGAQLRNLFSMRRETITSGLYHVVIVNSNCSVNAFGGNDNGQCNVHDWRYVIAVSSIGWHTVGLKSDGTAVATGENEDGECDISDWTDLVAVSAGAKHTVGLKSDGTVVAAGYNVNGECNVSEWKDIVAISAGGDHTVGLKSDGTVVVVGLNSDSRCDVNEWKDIVAVSAGGFHTVGLKSDGTVVAVGANEYGMCDVSEWRDIVAISAGVYHTVGLKADGTVVAVGDNEFGACDLDEWTDCVAISGGNGFTAGVRQDHSIIATTDYFKIFDIKSARLPY